MKKEIRPSICLNCINQPNIGYYCNTLIPRHTFHNSRELCLLIEMGFQFDRNWFRSALNLSLVTQKVSFERPIRVHTFLVYKINGKGIHMNVFTARHGL